jgi:hypothetical protein
MTSLEARIRRLERQMETLGRPTAEEERLRLRIEAARKRVARSRREDEWKSEEQEAA